MIELFDKKFVHFMWDDELEGKKCFVSDSIGSLKIGVEQTWGNMFLEVARGNGDYPFAVHWTDSCFSSAYKFAYYDPNYEVKKAFNEGKKVQHQLVSGVDWGDIDSEEALECRIAEGRTFRIKPEDKWIAYLARYHDGLTLCCCAESYWEKVATKIDNAKTQLFAGSEAEAKEWCTARQKFTETIKAFEDGKEIQVTPKGTDKWVDLHCEPTWDLRDEYRVKPDVEKESCIAYLQRYDEECWLSTCYECEWKEMQEKQRAKTKLFVGSEDEVTEWRKSRQKFAKVIKAWEDGKTIQFRHSDAEAWADCYQAPFWNPNTEYRVKPECPCEDGIDSKACVGCEHSEDGKPEYKPYESASEFVQNYQERFRIKYNPSWSMPMIWLWDKELDRKCLVRDFESDKVMCGSTSWTMEELFDRWTYLDGSPVGKEVKEWR